jgi:glycosyltransferase involved in cell wall biosynthesis
MLSLRFLTIHRPDRSPSQRFRYEQYLDTFRKAGYQLEFSYLLDQAQDEIYYRPGHLWAKAGIVRKAIVHRARELRKPAPDLLFVQREAFMLGSSWFERQMARRAPMIFDFDDAIWLADVSSQNRHLAWLKSRKKTGELIRASREVIAGNQYLADYARRFNAHTTVIPTTIDTEYHRPLERPRRDAAICIGWTGSHTTVPYFHAFSPVLEQLKARYGARIRFKLIGDPTYRNPALDLQGHPWRLENEVEDLNDLDIGIMPLPDDEWTRGKCGFKGLQYMACGIPAVMERVGVNPEIVRDGENGFLATSPQEWLEKLSELVESEELRRRLGAAGRQTVIDRYSVQSQKQAYLDVLARALDGRSSLSVR